MHVFIKISLNDEIIKECEVTLEKWEKTWRFGETLVGDERKIFHGLEIRGSYNKYPVVAIAYFKPEMRYGTEISGEVFDYTYAIELPLMFNWAVADTEEGYKIHIRVNDTRIIPNPIAKSLLN